MKKIINLLCVSMMFSMTSLTVSADNETSVATQITDAQEIYSILAPFVEKNYANEAKILYNEDEDLGMVGVSITFRQRAIGESESDVTKMVDEICDYMKENNIDPSFAPIFVLDDEPDNETSVATQITDAQEIYSILAPFVEKNYANEAKILYNEDEDLGMVGVSITFRQRAIGESESDVTKMVDEICDYMKENNIDPSFAPIFVLDDEPDSEPSIVANNKAGDLNSDGKIDVTDLSELSLALADGKEFTDEQQKAADVDKDGKVTLSDLARIKQYISNIITSFC